MTNIDDISDGLKLGEDGIWYASSVEQVSYPDHGHDGCFELEDSSFWFRHRNNCISTAVGLFHPSATETIFDVGGGNGFVSKGLIDTGYHVVLVEPGKAGARHAKRRGIETVVCATTDTAKFSEESLPGIGLFDVIEHIEDDVGFLKSMNKITKPDGMVYATVPAYSLLWSDEDEKAGHYRRYRKCEIERAFEAAGFEIVFSSYIFRFLPLPILLLRALPYRLGLIKKDKQIDAYSDEHAKRSGAAGRLLTVLLNSEINALKSRKSMSMGGSCLVVAKKV